MKKTAAESYWLLGEAYDKHAPSQKTMVVNDGFSVSKLEISMLQTRNTENRPKSTKTWNCKHCWMKMIHKYKNNSQSNWALVNKLFQSPTKDGKDSERWVPHELNERQFCSNDTEESHSCIISFLGMKSGFFLESQLQKIMGAPKCKKSGAPSTSTRPNRFGRKTMLCVCGTRSVVYYELLKPGKTVNTKRYQQQLINLNWNLFAA